VNLEGVKIAVRKLNHLFDHPDVATDFNQQLDQLLAELDAARRPLSARFLRTSYRPPSGDGK